MTRYDDNWLKGLLKKPGYSMNKEPKRSDLDPLPLKNHITTMYERTPTALSIAPSKDIAGMNKTEAAWWANLKAQNHAWLGAQNITLKLADDCRYTPDFFFLTWEGKLHAHETKGFFRDDAKVKIKVAARLFPFIEFTVVTKEKGEWKLAPISP